MKKQVKIAIFTLLLAALPVGVAAQLAQAPVVGAVSAKQKMCEGSGGTWAPGSAPGATPAVEAKCTNGSSSGSIDDLFKNIVNVLLFVIGGVAVIMIVVGGLRYVLSNGESSAVTGAKNTILYAVVGLVIALFAYAIVNFVLKNF